MHIPALVKSCLLLLIVSVATGAGAQTNGGIWESGSGNIQNAKSKATKKVSAFKSWKDQMQKWGLDSDYTRSLAICGSLNSDGWSAGIVYGRKSQSTRLSLWQLNFSEVKDEKETIRQGSNASFPELGSGTPYIFGKINSPYQLNFGYSQERILIPTFLYGDIAVGVRYSSGISLAILKPYYLKIIHADYTKTPTTVIVQEEEYSERNKDLFLNTNFILGKSKWSDGLSSARYVPGLYGEVALTILHTGNNIFIQTIVLGVRASAYTESLPVVALTQSHQLHGDLFASLEFGKRWKRSQRTRRW